VTTIGIKIILFKDACIDQKHVLMEIHIHRYYTSTPLNKSMLFVLWSIYIV